ncbi:MAG: FtsK/SpoIIIE domain-containing protein [Chloroflexi bacterium]|nr:FtsK/SpoIIIE domain-containing protein [Chloroflexota bacterium]MCL5275582.1 FtsK/SpoIIIE domain-containing protein [Chloroflexota bacterium]
MIMTLVPVISVLGFLFASGTGNIALVLPMGLAVVASIGAAFYQRAKDKQDQAAKEKAYSEMLLQMRQDMTRSHTTQRIFYQYNYPDVDTLIAIAARKDNSRFGPRLWERRPTDMDFGAIRLGSGSRPSTVIYKVGEASDPNERPIMKDARRLAEDSRILTDAAITIPLRPFTRPGETEAAIQARHAMGIYGRNTTNVTDFAHAVLANFAAFQSPQDARMFVIGNPQSHTSWEWAEWLPHCFSRSIGDDETGKPKEYEQLCFAAEKDKVSAFWKRIKKELDQRQIRLRDTRDDDKKTTDVTLPFLLVVIDTLGEMPANSPLKDVAAEAAVATILKSGPTLGAAVIFLANEPGQVPSDCLAMTEVASVGERVVFRYTEVGLNTPRYLGQADQLNAADARQKFAAQIRRLDLLRPFGADVPRAVTLLQMQSVVEQRKLDTIDKLSYKENWVHSLAPKNQEWLNVPIGMLSMKDVRTLIFSAKEGGDGVHGMIAGTTGSGKSELLMTLIAGMAIRYDPRIVNFVLVDYKGGAAFEPFRKLPHVVDILTNLQGSAVERMFVAIQAVMEERAALLAKSGVSDLVKYRSEVAPRLKPEDPRPNVFPHLFIIVDEFAEMITANPEYRRQFESITRLGRAFGVSLILATQRPAGVVSDQMRSNMKFRICLRVETPDDSKELLGGPDAAFLPNIGGRGYVQSGNELMTPVQVAWAGGSYSDDRNVSLKDVIWLDEESIPSVNAGDAPEYTATEIAEALALKPGELPKTVLDWAVGVAAIRAQRDGVPVQTKPWPNPLPEFLSLTTPVDATFLNTERTVVNNALILNENVNGWLENTEEKPLWKPYDWKNPRPLFAEIGLVDNPYRAEQRVLNLEVSGEPIVLFRGSGRGKKVFLKSLLLALAAQRSPDSLHMYAFDFGRGGLKAITALPHLGAAIDASETARVEQLMRMLRNFVNERQERLSKYSSLADHNAKNPNSVLPEIVVVIDNFAEFKESYEHLLPELMSLVRDGRAFGVYFVVTATVINDLPGKLYNLFTQRLTMTQNDRSIYSEIVGSGARNFDNVPGRGLIAVSIKEGEKAIPLEFQIGMPGKHEESTSSDQIDLYQLIAQRMDRVWAALGGKRPSAELPRALTLLQMFEIADGKPIAKISDLDIIGKWQRSMQPANQEWLRAWLGLISSKDLRMMVFQAQADGVHGMAAGTTGSGKSEMLQTLIAALAIRYDPRIINFVLIDYKGGPTIEPFRKLPHCVDMATNLQGNAVDRIFIAINAEMNRRSEILAKAGVSDLVEYRKKVIPTLKPDSPLPDTFPHLFIIVDEFAEMVAQSPEYKAKFESITRLGRSFGVSLLLATQRPTGVVTDQMRSNMKFRIALRMETPEDSKELLKKPDAARLPQIAGRGYVQAGTEALTEVQVAWSGAPYDAYRTDAAYPADDVLVALEKVGDPPRSLLGWLVGSLAAEAKRQGIPKQFKPWPDPLPELMPINTPLDASYLSEVKEDQVVLSPALAQWASAELANPADFQKYDLWKLHDWNTPLPMKASIGLVDDPFHSNQRRMTLNAGSDPIVVFGASGRGKSTFVKSLLFALAAQRSPSELNYYLLDFGRGGLRAVSRLPHCGASIDAGQPDRVAALFRMIRGVMSERQERLSHYASLEDYNAQHKDNPELMFPSIVMVIDNFAEFRENYESMFGDLINLVRDGRQFGIYFIITASQMSDINNKLFNLLSQRLVFTMADAAAYGEIVGRGALPLANLPGRGLINIDGQPLEFHIAIPVIDGVKDAFTHIAERMDAAWISTGGKRPSAEIPKAITFLEMMQLVKGKRVDRIGDLEIDKAWQRSMQTANQEWLSAPLGLISSKEIRTLIFNAKAGGDGVHGMAAGTTGSGKSEMLQTLIASMCIKYDPRIVNFVLIDYKGGPTVEPFRKLPHCVDIATNLEGNAVERIFTAINAEMNRRSEILAKAGVADLVDYRKKVIPSLKPDSPFPNTFPHLFIIVDEFAEMVTQNPEYKAKFESITRLGRSFGVSLLLATQRPSGAVTDQMRANMKYRISLRVETTDDSKEMIGRPDAATLPAIPGRGYVQVGGGNLSEIQVAYSGASYDETRPDPRYNNDEIMAALESTDAPRSLLGWLVGSLAAEARRQNIPKQFKPWPSPLPDQLPMNRPINAEYIAKGKYGKEIVINPAVAEWMANKDAEPIWKAHDWSKPLPVSANIGIIDNTLLAEQRVLNVDLSGDPMIVFGASGRGKTTFVKSLLIALAAQRRPDELHIYCLDFGRGGLKALRALPHVGGIVETNEEERVERFMRMIRNIIDDRQQKLQSYDSMDDYNARNPDAALPSVVVVVDNAVEFRETYDKYLPDLLSLLRDGRSFGVYFVMTASLLGDITNKMLSLLNQRITFTQADRMDYFAIVGRGAPRINDTPGRGLCVGLVDDKPTPLEFHTAAPLSEDPADQTDYFRVLTQTIAQAWAKLVAGDPSLKGKCALPVEPLTKAVDIATLLPAIGQGSPKISVPLGITDLDRSPTVVDFVGKGPHWIVMGPPVTGKTTTMRSLVMALAHCYSPDQVGLILVDPADPSRRFYNFGIEGEYRIDKLPHVLATVSTAKEMDEVVRRLRAEYDEEVIGRLSDKPDVFSAQDNNKRHLFVLADNYDDIEPINRNRALSALNDVGKGKNLHLVLCGTINGMRSGMDELRKRAEGSRYAYVFNDYEAVRYMGVRGTFSVTKELPPGRGFMVKAVSASMTQMALPYVEGRPDSEAQYRSLIDAIMTRYPNKAKWSYFAQDTAALETAIKGDAAQAQAAGATATAAPGESLAAPTPADQLPDWQSQMEDMLKGLPKFEDVGQVDPSRMASVTYEVPDEPVPAGNGAAETVSAGGDHANVAAAGNGTGNRTGAAGNGTGAGAAPAQNMDKKSTEAK